MTPRLGFLGLGWIGLQRMEALLDARACEAVALCDPDPARCAAARDLAPRAVLCASLAELLASDLDGVVIATPSGLHADQSIAALEGGLAVFCQKPLGASARESRAVIAAARATDRLLGVDFCYRHTEALRRVFELLRAGSIGQVHAVDLVFHNAYGPNASWAYDRQQAGGGALMDLGVHLLDAALLALDTQVDTVRDARLFHRGRPPRAEEVEDMALATLDLENGTVVRLACSWRASIGRGAEIEARFVGASGALAFRNVNGSFFDFAAERLSGDQAQTFPTVSDDWSARAAVDWAQRLGRTPRFDPELAGDLLRSAEAIDQIYAVARRLSSSQILSEAR